MFRKIHVASLNGMLFPINYLMSLILVMTTWKTLKYSLKLLEITNIIFESSRKNIYYLNIFKNNQNIEQKNAKQEKLENIRRLEQLRT